MYKYCNTCESEQLKTNFYNNRTRPDGLGSACKTCLKLKSQTSEAKAYIEKRRLQNHTKDLARKRSWYQDNKERMLTYYQEYRKDNPHMNQTHVNKARASKKKAACLNWDDIELNTFIIKELYEHSTNLSNITGVKHHVDHIIPLQGKLVCGLHHYTNLQVITAKANLSKSNSYLVT